MSGGPGPVYTILDLGGPAVEHLVEQVAQQPDQVISGMAYDEFTALRPRANLD